jgi:hypothetical protein
VGFADFAGFSSKVLVHKACIARRIKKVERDAVRHVVDEVCVNVTRVHPTNETACSK